MVPLMTFHLSFRALIAPAETPRNFRRSLELLLSWDSPAFHPSAVRPSARPLPEAEASFGPTVPPVESRSALVVSHHLDGFLRAGAAGLLHPAAGSGVRRVSCFRHPRAPEGGLDGRRIPRAAGHTLRRVPLISSRTASLRPLPSCLCCTFSSPGPARPGGRASGSFAGGRGLRFEPCTRLGRGPCWCCSTASRSRWWCLLHRRPKPLVVLASSPAEAFVDAFAARGLRRVRRVRIASEEGREPVRTATAGWPSAEPRGARSTSRDRSPEWCPPATEVARWRRRAGALPW
jgi:hypothetical protein